MEHCNLQDARFRLLNMLQPTLMVLALITFILLYMVRRFEGLDGILYLYLFIFILGMCAIAWLCSKMRWYYTSIVLTITMISFSIVYTILIERHQHFYNLFPLIYVTVSILISSLFLSLRTTVLITAVHYAFVISVILNTPKEASGNWKGLLVFILFQSVLSIVVNVVVQRQLHALNESSIRDPLTNLFNRRYFNETLLNRLQRCIAQHSGISVILIDVDNFKQCNDRYGHQVGDLILKRISTTLFEHVGIIDTVCRLGGDEFAIICSANSKELTESLRQDVQDLVITHGTVVLQPITISLGYARFPEEGTTAHSLIKVADDNLYLAKQRGRNCVVGPVL